MYSETIHVALATDRNYLRQVLVTIRSVMVSARPKTKLVFHVFTEQVSENETREMLASVIDGGGGIEVHPLLSLPVPDTARWSGCLNVWARVFFPELLSELDWVIYLDADILCLKAINDLWAQRDEAYLAAAVRSRSDVLRAREGKWIQENYKIPFDESNYFNSGVLLMNLRQIRNEGLLKQVREWIASGKIPAFPDQTMLNALFFGKVKILSDLYNQAAYRLTDERLLAFPIIHYAGSTNHPWSKTPLSTDCGHSRLWHTFANHYCWGRHGASERQFYSCIRRIVKTVLWHCLANQVMWCLLAPLLRLKWSNVVYIRETQVLNDCRRNHFDEIFQQLGKVSVIE